MAMTLRLPTELDAQLEELAMSEHVSKQTLVTEAVAALLARKGRRQELDEGLAWALEHDAELLRRLEDA